MVSHRLRAQALRRVVTSARPYATALGQRLGLRLSDHDRHKLAQLDCSERRDQMLFDDLAITLGGFGRNIVRNVFVEPTSQPFGHSLTRGLDIPVVIERRQDPTELAMGVVLRPMDSRVALAAFAGHGVGADVVFQFPAAWAALSDRAFHLNLPISF